MTRGVIDLRGSHWRNCHTGVHIEVLGLQPADSNHPETTYVRSSSGRHFWMTTSMLRRNYSRVVNH
jgi:hypothetical protein